MIVETLKTVEMHLSRAGSMREEMLPFIDALAAEDFSDNAKIKIIDAFLFRFIKTQDLMGNKLFREVLDRLGEYDDSMSMLDILDRMEKLELIDSADTWMDYRNLRNTLTHEYPDNKEVVIQGIKTAVQVFVSMDRCFRHIVSYLETRGLLR